MSLGHASAVAPRVRVRASEIDPEQILIEYLIAQDTLRGRAEKKKKPTFKKALVGLDKYTRILVSADSYRQIRIKLDLY